MDSENDTGEHELAADAVAVPMRPSDRLRAARVEQGLDLDHVAAETRIPLRHLETIEAGEYGDLPSRTYAIGFTRTYARTLGLDDREITDAVREELSDRNAHRTAVAGGMEPGDPAKLPSRGLAWFGAIAALILAVGMVAFYNTYFAAGSGPAPLTAEAEAEGDADAVADGAAAGGADSAIDPAGKVVFTAVEDGIWVRFYEANGERLHETVMANGETFEVPADAQEPLLNTGRPDVLAITIDGREVPRLANEPITLGDTPVSAAALLARPAATATTGVAPTPAAATPASPAATPAPAN